MAENRWARLPVSWRVAASGGQWSGPADRAVPSGGGRSAAGAEADVGQIGRGKGVRPFIGEDAVTSGRAGGLAAAVALPLLPEAHHLFVAAADEVPPHDDLLTERLTAQEEDPGGLGRAGLQCDRGGAGGLEHDLTHLGGGAAHGQAAGVAEEPVLVDRVDFDLKRKPGR